MVAVLRQHDFARLWLAGLVSQLGDWALFIALPFWVYERTGSDPEATAGPEATALPIP